VKRILAIGHCSKQGPVIDAIDLGEITEDSMTDTTEKPPVKGYDDTHAHASELAEAMKKRLSEPTKGD